MNLALNPFGKGKKPEKVEDVKLDESLLEELTLHYLKFQEEFIFIDEVPVEKIMKYHIFKEPLKVLKPGEIDLFLQKMDDFKPDIFGLYLNRLIQKSYDNGNNDFCFQYTNYVEHFCSYLDGKRKNKLRIKAYGDIDCYDGMSGLHDCEVEVFGRVASLFGVMGKHSLFKVHGSAGTELGCNSEHCVYHIDGTVDALFGLFAKKCTFRFNKLLRYPVLDQSEGCKIEVTDHDEFEKLSRLYLAKDYTISEVIE
ncbi:hypothetical protein KY330_05770 [Candidatus Woesearchaeota archaeon]|nr:hypothetical protein [Candidatus Woesearchaeota archaeon]